MNAEECAKRIIERWELEPMEHMTRPEIDAETCARALLSAIEALEDLYRDTPEYPTVTRELASIALNKIRAQETP